MTDDYDSFDPIERGLVEGIEFINVYLEYADPHIEPDTCIDAESARDNLYIALTKYRASL